MGYASQAGRARTNAKKPQAFAVCDRCGIWYNWVNLRWQYDWRGASIQNLRILVCERCYDMPQEQLRAIVLPEDPTPILNARTENFRDDETDYRTVSFPTVYDPITGLPIPSTVKRVTQDCQNRTLLPFGNPVGFDQNAVMPLQGTVHYGVPIDILSVMSDGSATVTVTCSRPHGLQNDSQVSVQGLSYRFSNGFYSVDVVTATVFTYMTYGLNPSGSLLMDGSRIVNCKIGLPIGYQRIPKISGPPLSSLSTPPIVCFLATEDGTGIFLLESGGGFIQLERCNNVPQVPLLELENGTGTILLEGGLGSIELEIGP